MMFLIDMQFGTYPLVWFDTLIRSMEAKNKNCII